MPKRYSISDGKMRPDPDGMWVTHDDWERSHNIWKLREDKMRRAAVKLQRELSRLQNHTDRDPCEAWECDGEARHWTEDAVHLCEDCWRGLVSEKAHEPEERTDA